MTYKVTNPTERKNIARRAAGPSRAEMGQAQSKRGEAIAPDDPRSEQKGRAA